MQIKPSDRLKVLETIKRTEQLWKDQAGDTRARFIASVTMVEALIELLAENHGRRKTWEWLQRVSDDFLERDLPQ